MALPRPEKERLVPNADDQRERRSIQREKNREAVELLRSWREGDDDDLDDQREIMKALRVALGEARPSYRKLF